MHTIAAEIAISAYASGKPQPKPVLSLNTIIKPDNHSLISFDIRFPFEIMPIGFRKVSNAALQEKPGGI
jgi:hypothetical protein